MIIIFIFLFILQPIEINDEVFWDQFWNDSISNVNDLFALIPASEIRTLREECPSNLATLCYKVTQHILYYKFILRGTGIFLVL